MFRRFALVLLGTALLAACSRGDAPEGATGPAAAGATPTLHALGRAALLVDAELMVADYAADPIAAQARYDGKAFFVTGRMQRTLQVDGAVWMELKAADPQRPVAAKLAPSQVCGSDAKRACTADEAVADLLRGAKVYLDCTGAPARDAVPQLTNCSLVPAGASLRVR